MKRETKVYPYDWMLWSILGQASKCADGTAKEYRELLELVPHFKDVLHAFVRQGEPGVLFLKLLAEYTERCLTARDRGKKVAMTSFCVATPLLYALDVVPLSLEAFTVIGTVVLKRGTAEYLDYCCEIGFTETSCSAQRGALGAYLAGLGSMPDFIVCDSPGICDTNANAFAFASAYMDIPFYQLNYPSTLTGERATRYHRQDFRNLLSFLEEQTGNRLDEAVLRRVVEETRHQDDLTSELLEFQRLVPTPLPGIFDLILYGGKFMMGGMPTFTRLLEAMLDRAKENARLNVAGTTSREEKLRGLFCYIDHYTSDVRFWEWLDDCNISHLGSMLFTFWQQDAVYAQCREEESYFLDSTSLDSMIDSLADQISRMPMVKQIRGPYDAPHMWRDDVFGMVRVFKPDFVVYIGTIGCRNTWGSVKLLMRDMERAGVPSLMLYADAFDDRIQSWEAIIDRLNEFIHVRRLGK